MYKKLLFYTGIILFPFFWSQNAVAQQNRERHRSVTITQTVVDGKVLSTDTLITYTDTTTRTVNSKEISMEMPYTKGSTIYIDNAYRKLNIRQSKDGKVRLSTTAFYYGEPAFTNEQWLEKLNIRMQKSDSGIVISSGGISTGSSTNSWGGSGYSYSFSEPPTPPAALTVTGRGSTQNNGTTVTQNGALREVNMNNGSLNGTTVTQYGAQRQVTVNGYASTSGTAPAARGWSSSNINSTAVFDEKGNISYNSSSLHRELTLYIPADAKLDIISKYADVSVDHDLTDIKTSISNASLDMLNAGKVNILSTYSNLSMGNVTDANISVTSGKLFMKDVAQLQLVTKYAKVEAGNCGTLSLQSISDDYDIDEVKNLSGQKTYGSFRVDKLTGSFDLKGSSADVKIRNIEPTVSAITIDNKYADVRLPVTDLKNYEVLFSGNYSNVFAPFERRDTTIEKTATGTDAFSYNTTNGTVVSKTKPGFAPANQSGTIQRNDDNRIIYTNTDGSITSIIRPGTASRSRTSNFVATVGDTKGIHTMFNLTCTSCNVDFK